MRKFIYGFVAVLFVVVFTAVPASAEYQENAPKKNPEELHTTSTPVECTFHNFTYASNPEEWAYYVGDEIDFEVTLSDPDELVATILFSAGTGNKGGVIQESSDRSAVWTIPAAGEWTIGAQLFGHDGSEIIPSGDCDGAVKALEQPVEPAHPETPDEETPPATEDPCADADPSTLVPVTNDDGSVSYYTPDGDFCADVLPHPPTDVQETAKPVVQPAVESTAVMTELPRTGTGLTITVIVGGALVLMGFFFSQYARRLAPCTLPAGR